ncbi:hypothetical protein [Pseudoalteromonas sp. C8]|uniref:hypothetical protein n=1 Tax=Pseudoalteromonas sp. C8 TaxID=2686345 RepID=UPI0013FD41CD|nr:hypothetical protein [Pseudoalteromonas sp. C8]
MDIFDINYWIALLEEFGMFYLTDILVFLTAIYAYLTHKMVKVSEESVNETRIQTEALTRPYITIQPILKKHSPVIFLSIKNTGLSAASNLRISIDRDFFQFNQPNNQEKNLRNFKIFNAPIKSFAPNYELTFPLAQSFIILGGEAPENCPSEFIITTEYEFAGKSVIEENYIDIEVFTGGEVDMDPLVSEVEKIRKSFEPKA